MRILHPSGHSTVAFAASELATYLEHLGLTDVCTAANAVQPVRGDIVLHLQPGEGLPAAIAALVPSIRDDGFAGGGVDGILYLTATTARGVLAAVYDFLERHCGVVFAGPGMEFLPQLTALPPLPSAAVSNPDLAMRFLGLHALGDPALLPALIDWLAKRRFNGLQLFAPQFIAHRSVIRREAVELRGMGLDVGAHSAFFFLPPARFLASHPQYFAKDINGVAVARQLCYSNQAMVAALADAVCAFLDHHAEVTVVGLWPEDGMVSCHCRDCAGQTVAPLIYQRIAEAAGLIACRHPQVLINHLSYLNSTRPPEGAVPLPDNVLVNHCDYWDRTLNRPVHDFRYGTKPLKNSRESAEYARTGASFRDHREICAELRAWKRLTRHPTVFSYYSDLIIKQRLITDVATSIRLDMGFLRDLGYRGFVDCCCHPEEWMAMAWNLYALGVFAWHAEADEDAVRRDFVRGAFGLHAVEAGLRFYRRLGELENDPSVLGFNTLDLLHRNPQETRFFAEPEAELIEPCRARYERQLARLTACVDQLADHGAPADRLASLRSLVGQLGERLRSQFANYVGEQTLTAKTR